MTSTAMHTTHHSHREAQKKKESIERLLGHDKENSQSTPAQALPKISSCLWTLRMAWGYWW